LKWNNRCSETRRGNLAKPNIVVLIKQVPDMDQVEFDYERGRIIRGSAPSEANPFDLNALETAVAYKEKVGGEVIALSMGPQQAESTLREALARGADRTILLSDKGFAGADTWATSIALGEAVRKISAFDLIICGEKTVDGDTGQVGPEVAEFLDIPHVSYVSAIRESSEKELVVETEAWGRPFLKRLQLPGLITVTKDINEPRLPSFKDKMRARKADVEIWGIEDISVDPNSVGIKGSPTLLKKMWVPAPQKREAAIIRGDPVDAVKQLLKQLDMKGSN
jgi:electron transfer flavoprotein beta subunit